MVGVGECHLNSQQSEGVGAFPRRACVAQTDIPKQDGH